jgi:hypothetical protein
MKNTNKMKEFKEIDEKIEELKKGIEKLNEMIMGDYTDYMKEKLKRSKDDIQRDIDTLEWTIM